MVQGLDREIDRKIVRVRIRDGQGKAMSSGHDRNIVLIDAKQLWLLAQDWHKIKPVGSLSWNWELLMIPYP